MKRKYNENFKQEDFEKMIEDYNKSKHKNWEPIFYCGAEEYMLVSSGGDQFSRAVCNISGQDPELWVMNEFLKRNTMTEEMQEEYRKCKEGDGNWTGEEYFYYNYCKINGKAPTLGSYSKEAFERYQTEVGRKREYLGKRRRNYSGYMEHPKTVEESFKKMNNEFTDEEKKQAQAYNDEIERKLWFEGNKPENGTILTVKDLENISEMLSSLKPKSSGPYYINEGNGWIEFQDSNTFAAAALQLKEKGIEFEALEPIKKVIEEKTFDKPKSKFHK